MFDTMIPLFGDSSLALIPHNMTFALLWLFCYFIFLIFVYRLIERFLLPDIRFGYTIASIVTIQICLKFLGVPSFIMIFWMALFIQSFITSFLMAFSPRITELSGKQALQLLSIFGVLSYILQLRARRNFKKEQNNQEGNQDGDYAGEQNNQERKQDEVFAEEGFNDGPPDPNKTW